MVSDIQRIETLYRQHAPALFGYLRRACGDPDLAEDLLQETFAAAMGGMDRLAAASSPRAWLFGIARNLSSNAVRRRRRTESLPEDCPSRSPKGPDDRLEQVRRGIALLDELHREPLELRLGDGLSYEEIAGVMGIPLGTVRSRLHHAMRRLRELVQGGETRAAGSPSQLKL